jgi:mono/diheme cytochrome c family protein
MERAIHIPRPCHLPGSRTSIEKGRYDSQIMIRKILLAILVLAILGAIGAGAAVLYVQKHGMSARDEPGAIETAIALQLRHYAVPAADRNRKNPLPATPENIRAGMLHFADHCAVCHNNNGVGDTDFGRGLYPKPPNMREKRTQSLTDGEMFAIIENGIRLSGMPAFGDDPTQGDEDTWKLVLFIRHIPKITDQEIAEMEKLNPKSPAEKEEEQNENEFLGGGKPAPEQPHTHSHSHGGRG